MRKIGQQNRNELSTKLENLIKCDIPSFEILTVRQETELRYVPEQLLIRDRETSKLIFYENILLLFVPAV